LAPEGAEELFYFSKSTWAVKKLIYSISTINSMATSFVGSLNSEPLIFF
jgi:hypothetical protein